MRDPGNLGTVLRSACAFGYNTIFTIDSVYISGLCVSICLSSVLQYKAHTHVMILSSVFSLSALLANFGFS